MIVIYVLPAYADQLLFAGNRRPEVLLRREFNDRQTLQAYCDGVAELVDMVSYRTADDTETSLRICFDNLLWHVKTFESSALKVAYKLGLADAVGNYELQLIEDDDPEDFERAARYHREAPVAA